MWLSIRNWSTLDPGSVSPAQKKGRGKKRREEEDTHTQGNKDSLLLRSLDTEIHTAVGLRKEEDFHYRGIRQEVY